MLRAFVIYVCCCVLIAIVIVVVVVLAYAMAERKETKLRCPAIKFKDFKEWFSLRPEAYTLRDSTVHRQNLGDFRFNMIDTIRYKFWKKRGFFRQAEENNEKQMQKLLSYVKRDIDMYENKSRGGLSCLYET